MKMLPLIALGWASLSVSACSVPVFRFALERWPASPYEIWVAHRGPLSPGQEACLTALDRKDPNSPPPANLRVHRVDLEASPPAALVELLKAQSIASLPGLIVRYPADSTAAGVAWSGPLTEENARRLVDSPMRRRIAQRLLKGDSAVWLLLESGQRSKDDAAATQIQTELERLQKTLRIAQLDPADVADGLVSVPEAELKVAFSFLRLSREDLAEDALIGMLTGSEEDLRETRTPIAFPIYGRGRVLYALVGDGINAENIEEACSFLIGPCSCVIKAENPGVDLLMSAAWESAIRSAPAAAPAPPELAGPGSFAVSADRSSSGTSATAVVSDSTPTPTDPAIPGSPAIRISLTAVLVLGGAAFLVGILLLWRK